MSKLAYDVGKAADILEKYSGETGAHLAFAVSDGQGREFSFGGNALYIAGGLLELLVKLMQQAAITDPEAFIRSFCDNALQRLSETEEPQDPEAPQGKAN